MKRLFAVGMLLLFTLSTANIPLDLLREHFGRKLGHCGQKICYCDFHAHQGHGHEHHNHAEHHAEPKKEPTLQELKRSLAAATARIVFKSHNAEDTTAPVAKAFSPKFFKPTEITAPKTGPVQPLFLKTILLNLPLRDLRLLKPPKNPSYF